MKLKKNQKRTLAWIISLVVCFGLSAGLGINYPRPVGSSIDAGAQAAGDTNFTNVVASGDITAGDDLTVGDTLNVDGDIDYDGDAFDVDTTGAISMDADSSSNFSTSSGDITVEAETGSVTIKGDEADAAAVFIDADQVVTAGLDINVGSVSGMTIDGGLLDIGGGTGGTANGDNDVLIAGDLEVDTNTVLDGDLAVDGTANLDDVDVDLSNEFNIDGELVCIGATGDGGTADGDDDLIVKGDLEVDDTLDVDGDLDLDGDAFDVNITGGFSIDSDASSNVSASAGDITIDAEAGSVVIIGSEAAADSVTIDANDTVTSGLDIDVGSVNGMTIDGGLVDIGSGTGGTADGTGDLLVAGDVEVDDTLDVDGDIDLDGDGFDVDITLGFSIDADLGSNVSTSVGDITIEAETGSVTIKGDEADAAAVFIDANETVTSGLDIDVGSVSGMTIDGGLVDIGSGTGGTADGTGDLLVAGDVEVDDTLDVDGDIDLDGDGFDVDITLGFSVDADLGSNVSTSVGDITIEAETGSVIIKGDEAAADAIHIDANDVATTGLDIDVGSVSGMTIDGGLLDIGGGSCDVANGDNDVCIADVLEVDGEAEFDGPIDADSTANFAGAVTLGGLLYFSGADETITDGEVLTPTVTAYNLSAASAVTMTLAASGTEWQPLLLCGDDNFNITINDTNVRTNDGGIQVIGQYDCILWIFLDNEWVEISESNNS